MELLDGQGLLNARVILIPDMNLHVVRVAYCAHVKGESQPSNAHSIFQCATIQEFERLNIADCLPKRYRLPPRFRQQSGGIISE